MDSIFTPAPSYIETPRPFFRGVRVGGGGLVGSGVSQCASPRLIYIGTYPLRYAGMRYLVAVAVDTYRSSLQVTGGVLYL